MEKKAKRAHKERAVIIFQSRLGRFSPQQNHFDRQSQAEFRQQDQCQISRRAGGDLVELGHRHIRFEHTRCRASSHDAGCTTRQEQAYYNGATPIISELLILYGAT